MTQGQKRPAAQGTFEGRASVSKVRSTPRRTELRQPMLPETYSTSAAPTPESENTVDERIAALAAFSRGVVHDLRNPLNVIVANLYLLRQRVDEADVRTFRPVERMADQVRAMEHLLNGYLALEQADHPSMQRMQLNEVVEGVAGSLTLPQGCGLELQLDPALPPIKSDPRLLESVLRALLRNSVRALGGEEGDIRITTEAGPGCVVLSVQDSGSGIDAEVLPRVFEPFFSTWEGHAGTGLPLLAKVARVHAGECVVQTTPGAGTRVRLELPIG